MVVREACSATQFEVAVQYDDVDIGVAGEQLSYPVSQHQARAALDDSTHQTLIEVSFPLWKVF